MEQIKLSAQPREGTGKTANKHLRYKDLIPAVVYKHGQKAAHIQLKEADFIHALHTSAGENAIIALSVASSEDKASRAKTVIIKEIQYHPTKEDILHIDFQEISLTEKITVEITVMLKGEAEGVKTDGGVLEQVTKDLKIECLPTEIPEKVDCNIEEMKIGDIIHVKELDVPANITVLTDPEQPVVSVSPPKEEAPEEEEGTEAEAQEPEVIAETKSEERQAEAADKEQKKAQEEKQEDQENAQK